MNINLNCPINNLGYGCAGLNIFSELFNSKHTVALFPIGQIQTASKYVADIKKSIENTDFFDVNAPCIKIWHQHDMASFIGKGKHIGFPIFELDKFNSREKHHLSTCDEIFVCSRWAKDVILNNLNFPENLVKIVPLGVDNSVFKPIISKRKPTIFLNVGKWEVRKGHDILPDLFSKSFNSGDNVELWMMNDNPFLNDEQTEHWKNLYRNSDLGDKIRFIPRVKSHEEVAQLMSQADCGLFPSRAEGWNLEILEMMACGKQIIATDYSGHTEFCDEANSHLVPMEELEPANDGVWFHGHGNWMKITNDNMKTLSNYMKHIHYLKQNGHLGINKNAVKTANYFSWKHTYHCLIDALT